MQPNLLIHFHVFYEELIEEALLYLDQKKLTYDLFVTYSCHLSEASLNRLKMISLKVLEAPNRGRDVAPFYIELKPLYLDYDYIGHIHTKRSVLSPIGDNWRKYLLSNLFRSELELPEIFSNNYDLIYPPFFSPLHLFVSDFYSDNIKYLKKIVKKGQLGVDLKELIKEPKRFSNDFPAGNMFFAKSSFLKPIFEMDFKYEDFPEEPIPKASIAHSLERLLYLLAIHQRKIIYHCYSGDSEVFVRRAMEESLKFNSSKEKPCLTKKILKRIKSLKHKPRF